MTDNTERDNIFVSPIGKLTWPYARVCEAAERPPLFGLNRYPRQAIGATVRLGGNRYLSIVWAKPARWWRG